MALLLHPVRAGRRPAAVGLLTALALLAGCASRPVETPYRPTPQQAAFESGDRALAGFDPLEARDAIEFCVELDNEDDRTSLRQALAATDPAPDAAQRAALQAKLDLDQPRIDASRWNPVPLFDSRDAVARAYDEFKALPTLDAQQIRTLPDDDIRHWFRLFEGLEQRAAKGHVAHLDGDAIRHDPTLNGFGPWQNAWLLYQGVGPMAGRYAVAIRGTVFSNTPSAIDDVYFQPVRAKAFLSPALSFSDDPTASVHSGFAHAAFTGLLDERFGILPVLRARAVPPGSTLYVIGHSQGAGIATLVHAALHYGLRDAELGDTDPLALKGLHYRLKSYAIAQPKPGDQGFAASFARITQPADSAIVINNDLDPVPQVPLTLQSTGDLADDFKKGSTLGRFVRSVSGVGAAMRGGLGDLLEPMARKDSAGYSHFYRWDKISPLADREAPGASWNFMTAGRLLWVYGPNPPPPDADDFYQHHATTYRALVQSQLMQAAR